MAFLPALLLVLAASPPMSPAPRPVPLATPAAQVLVFQGKVTVLAQGKTFPAAKGVLLEASDTLQVAENAWVAVALTANEHVVRLDDGVTLRVDELALFKAKPASESPEAQLNRLLTNAEQQATETRLIGWHAGQSAANVQPATPVGGTKALPPVVAGNFGGLPPSTATPATPAPSAAPSPATPPAPPPPPPPPRNQMPTPRTPPKPAKSDVRPVGPSRSGSGPVSREEATALASDRLLSACLQKELEAFGPELVSTLGGAVTIEFKRLANNEVRVRLDRGLPAPECARRWAESHGSEIPEKWTKLSVRLK